MRVVPRVTTPLVNGGFGQSRGRVKEGLWDGKRGHYSVPSVLKWWDVMERSVEGAGEPKR